jgi:hypothetical protein
VGVRNLFEKVDRPLSAGDDSPGRNRQNDKTRNVGWLTSYWPEAVVLALVILLWAPRLSGPIDLRWDGGVYYILGTSLATGHGYRILSEPGSPEALQYPPLLPAIIAVCQHILGSTDPAVVAPWLRKLNLTLFVVYVFAVLRLARRYLTRVTAVIAVTLCLLHFMTIFISDILSADLPFALVSVIFVLIAADAGAASRPLPREAASFVVAAAGFFLRTAGVALFAAWVLEAVVRRRWSLALSRAGLGVLPVVIWQLHVARVQGSYEYTHPAYEYQRAPYQFYNVSYAENIGLISGGHVHLGALSTHLRSDVGPLLIGLGESVSTSRSYWTQFLAHLQRLWTGRRLSSNSVLVSMPIICFSALVIAGLVILAVRRAWLMVFVPVVSIGLIWITPWPEQYLRYLMPLAPFLAVAAMLPLRELRASLRLRPGTIAVARIVLAGFVLLALTLQIYAAWQLFHRWRNLPIFADANSAHSLRSAGKYFYYTRTWQAWDRAVAWICANTPADAIIATPHQHLCYLRSNRRTVLPPMETDPMRARRLLEAIPVSYVIVTEMGEMAGFSQYSLPAVQGDPANWSLAYSADQTHIYSRALGQK